MRDLYGSYGVAVAKGVGGWFAFSIKYDVKLPLGLHRLDSFEFLLTLSQNGPRKE